MEIFAWLYRFLIPATLFKATAISEANIINGITDYMCEIVAGECCSPSFTRRPTAVKDLKNTLRKNFFGQHIAEETLIAAIESHLKDDSPSKPLVMSFHGWPGSGKTYLAELLVKSLYKKGLDSKYVKLYTGSYHFPDPKKVAEYKAQLKEEVVATLRRCSYSVFIFDEIDVTPPLLFDSLVPFLDRIRVENDVDHRKAIYIFLSNIAGSEINKAALQSWLDGKNREDLNFNNFHELVQASAFNAEGTGMDRTRMIDRHLINYFIPFLPMERRHIILCAKVELARLNGTGIITPEAIADEMVYWPPELQRYSQTGCKRVESIVKFYISKSKWEVDSDEDSRAGEAEYVPKSEL